MTLRIDHLVVAARTLGEGAAWVAERLGTAPAGGGKHALMGTHNRLLGLGRDAYLEVIAIDPEASAPARKRWFALDTAAMKERLARGPALIHWVIRTDDIAASVAAAPVPMGEVTEASRGDYRWRITVPVDGSLPAEGAFPTLIQWEGERHPAAALAEAGCRIDSLELGHPKAAELVAALKTMGLDPGEPVTAAAGKSGIHAKIRTPAGIAVLG